ncbi:MAG: hypothetical protein SCM11_16565 [Bacillota bacterium]|nr:hypothetical protein [Bacillota bacterium]
MIQIEQRHDLGWRTAWKLSNDLIELVVPEDVGPRVIHLGCPGGSNLFAKLPDFQGPGAEEAWRIYGGHRLWHSPEDALRTYYPDNRLVHVEPTAAGLIVQQETESTTQLQKSLEIVLNAQSVTVIHRIRNNSLWPLRYAAWAISAMAPGGTAFTRLRTKKSDTPYLSDLGVNIWPHTSMADSRALWGDQYFMLRQDTNVHQPFKVGLANDVHWVAYQNGSSLFIKSFDKDPVAMYPDNNSSIALYTCDQFSEIETLSPLREVNPGETVTHSERWHLLSVDQPLTDLDENRLAAMSWLADLYHVVG